MIYRFRIFRTALALLATFAGAAPTGSSPFQNERLRFNVNWPSGLSLGEAEMSAAPPKTETASPSNFAFNLDAGIPGFMVSDRYRSQASAEFCSEEFHRTTSHGQKKIDETTTFDSKTGKAIRKSAGGGTSELSASSCSRDALAYLYYVRHELSQGRIPPPQTIFLGAPYAIRLEFAGTQDIPINDKPTQADRFLASVKGPASSISFEVFFLKDAARTLALVRVPLAMGTFSMELAK